jgi:general secretion pathway protein A
MLSRGSADRRRRPNPAAGDHANREQAEPQRANITKRQRPMYETYWQLQQKPFENRCDPEFYFPGASHQAALLKLRYAIENHRGAALLAGASGTGKTLLVGMLRQVLGDRFQPLVHVVFPQMPPEELLAYLADRLTASQSTDPAPTVRQSIERIEAFLQDNARDDRQAVVVIDEAHLIEDAATWETLRLLLNLESSSRPALTLLIVGQPAILPLFERMPQLEERLAVKCLLRPLLHQETGDYVAHRLKTAGAQKAVFQHESLDTLFHSTQGIARRINRLCDLALLIGFAEEQDTISAANLEAVCQELVSVAAD